MKIRHTPHRRHAAWPIALTIAGSDSGGGAGLQADLKVFQSLRTHGTTAITCLTAQNPAGVTAVEPVSPEFLRAQLLAVFSELRPAAAKSGMLWSVELVREVVRWWTTPHQPPLVVDPVMIATSGSVLLRPDAVAAIRDELLPLAAIATPNLDEAAHLLGSPLNSVDDLRAAARELHARHRCAFLVKGGHLKNSAKAVDIFWDGTRELILAAPFVHGVSTHGTGCTYSAAIAAHLARGHSLPSAVRAAKETITRAISDSVRIGAHWALHPSPP
jgi:hydroxymethylpyrimidine/phosphomethylpyrimidine kinase